METTSLALPTPYERARDERELLACLALYLRVPASAIAESSLLDALVDAGTVILHASPILGDVVGIRDDERVAARRAAAELWSADDIRSMHHAAIGFWLENDDPCSAAYHHEQLGDHDAAVELLKGGWHTASFDVGQVEFLAMIQRLGRNPKDPDHVELLAIQLLVASMPWRSPENPGLNLQLLNVVPETLADLPIRSRIVITAAAVQALTAAERLKPAIAMGESFVAANLDIAGVDPSTWQTMPYLWNALGEAYVTAGLCSKGALYTSKAESLAAATDGNPFPRFRALAWKSVAYALNGESVEALRISTKARALSDAECWDLGLAHFPLIATDIVIAASTLDAEGLARASAVLKRTAPDSPLWQTTAAVCDAGVKHSQGELLEGITLVRRALNGTGEWGFIGIVRGYALGIHAELLLSQASGGDALSLLDDAQSSMSHTICFDIQRASAYILLGRPREVLKATDSCIAMGADHCLRTLPSILFRRAVAFEQLGLLDAADQAFREAFLLVRDSRSLFGLLSLPPAIIGRLFARLGVSHPDYAESIAAIVAVTARFPNGAGSTTDISTFTSREITLASMLRSGAEAVEIADALFLSTNTVKVHLRNIYRKLGVHTRAEALAKIEAAGFHSLQPRG
ncbi:MAG: hypothetical protein JWN80_266 [Microbacteriaceae bacterium]|nr:hypothetical protein [Microbacteriaceae bacterium]